MASSAETLSTPKSTAWCKVARATDVVAGRPSAASAGGLDLVLVRTDAGIAAYEARCPHQGTLLSEGDIVGKELVCRAHGWRFECATGHRPGRTSGALSKLALELRGDEVWVQIPEMKAPSADPSPRRAIAELPGPRAWPVVGNILDLDVKALHVTLEAWTREYGDFYTYKFGRRPVLVISDPSVTEQILRARPAMYRRFSAIQKIFAEVGVDGVFSAEGETWRAQRRLAMETLSSRHVRGFFPTLERVIARLRERWLRSAGEVIDLQEDLMRFTVDVTTSLAFSVDMNTLERGDDVIQRHLQEIFPAINRRLGSPFPYWHFVKLPSDRALDRALAAVHELLDALIIETRAKVGADPGREPSNFLEAMVLARDEDGKSFDDGVIFANALTMLLAGEDTTANTLAWLVHETLERPDVWAKLREEVDAVLGAERLPNLETANRLPYTDAVAQETMRVRPVAPMLYFEANEDTVAGDVQVPKGTFVVTMLRAPCAEEKHFADAKELKPERWLEGRPEGDAHLARAHLPFGSGPRICPGRSLALLEMRLVIATLVRNFEIERVGAPTDVKELFSFTMTPVGLRVRLRPRA